MGNRANVVFEFEGDISPTIYLHWNGGPESVYAFLAEMDRRGVTNPARFVQIVGEFFDGHKGEHTDMSVYLTHAPEAITPEAINKVPTDDGDNGFYVVSRDGDDWKVRRFTLDYKGPGEKDEHGFHVHGTPMREWTPEQVAQEHETAMKSDYGPDIAKAFIAWDVADAVAHAKAEAKELASAK